MKIKLQDIRDGNVRIFDNGAELDFDRFLLKRKKDGEIEFNVGLSYEPDRMRVVSSDGVDDIVEIEFEKLSRTDQ